VAYSLQFDSSVLSFLRGYEGLTREGRIRLFANLDLDLRQLADFYINDPDRRLSTDPLRFFYDIVFRDPPGAGPLRHFRFVVNAGGAAYGVLEVEYVDEGGPPMGQPATQGP
jgi:hypothetical protein